MKHPLTLALQLGGPQPGLNVLDADQNLLWRCKTHYDRDVQDLELTVHDANGPEDQFYRVKTQGDWDLLRYTPLRGDTLYAVTGPQGRDCGMIKRRGGLGGAWQGHYELLDHAGNAQLTFAQENPAAAIANAVVESIPVVGELIATAVLNPTYAVTTAEGKLACRLETGTFVVAPTYTLAAVEGLPPELEPLAVVVSMLMILHEAGRS